MPTWDGETPISVAVLVDIDGTICTPPVCGSRTLRPDAVAAFKELSMVGHVILWSMGGRNAGVRVLEQFPQLKPYVCHVTDKNALPFHLIDLMYSIDDGDVTECVRKGNRLIIDRYKGGEDSGLLLEAASIIADDIRRNSR
ncbi:MAG: hypothetical protein P8181_16920 [bacterium]